MQQLHPEDSRLTAYVLGELSPEEAAAIERAAAADPGLRTKIQEMTDIQDFLTERLSASAEQRLPRQRENIRRNPRQAESAAKSGRFASLQVWIIPAAAVLALATLILTHMPADKPLAAAGEPQSPLEPAPVPPPASVPPPAAVPPPVPAAWFLPENAVGSPTLDLPVVSEKSNFAGISKSIREDGRMPPHHTVRLEQILNNFAFRLNGVTAIARGTADNHPPDELGTGIPSHLATLSTEMIPCPWKPSASLLLISIRGNGQTDRDVKVTFHPEPANIFRYRLLGFNPVEGLTPGDLPTKLPAKSATTLAIEIEPSTPAGNLGSLEWSADGKPAPGISLVRKGDAEPSDDARFAALVCTFAQWLAAAKDGLIDAEIVAALAREIASTTLAADRADFLNLIDRSLHL